MNTRITFVMNECLQIVDVVSEPDPRDIHNQGKQDKIEQR